MRSTLLTVLALLLALPAAGQVYKWIDSNGKAHYGDSPPGDVKNERLRIDVRSHEGPAQVTDWAAILRRGAPPTARSHAVTMYSTSWCVHCKRARNYFNAHAIRYNEIDVEATPQGKRQFAELGGGGVPLILVGDKAMRGFDEATLAGLLKKSR
jgi:glutaredoxin